VNRSIEQIEQWIISHHPEINHLPPDIDLIENRLIDSLRFMEFIFFLEVLSGRAIEMTELALEDFRTVHTIAEKFCPSSAHGVVGNEDCYEERPILIHHDTFIERHPT